MLDRRNFLTTMCRTRSNRVRLKRGWRRAGVIHEISKDMAPSGEGLHLQLAELHMNKFFKVAVWFAVGVAASSSAFASGYGPAPHYSPLQGAPASQQGPSAIV